MPEKALPRFLKVEEVADLLRCKKRTIYDMVEQERIPYRKSVEDYCLTLMKSLSGPNKSSRGLRLAHLDEYIAGRSPGCNRKGER